MLPASWLFVIVPLKLAVVYPVASAKLKAGVASAAPSEILTPPREILEFASLTLVTAPSTIAPVATWFVPNVPTFAAGISPASKNCAAAATKSLTVTFLVSVALISARAKTSVD